MMRQVLGSFVAIGLLSITACGSHKTKGGDPTTETPDVNGEKPAAEPGQVLQTGRIVDFDSKKALKGATVTAGATSVTTDDTGAYVLAVEKGKPFTMEVTMEGYAKLTEQETALDADFDRGDTRFIASGTAKFLMLALDGYDPSLGILSVQLLPGGNCASEEGAKITVSPPGAAKVKYVYGGIPSAKTSAVTAGQFPSAVLYNVDPGVQLSVEVTSETCKLAAFPVEKDGVRYTGGIVASPGEATSFARVFLQ